MDKHVENISVELLETRAAFNNEIHEKLSGLNISDFLVHNFLDYPQSHVYDLLISYNKILGNLSLHDWINILRRINDSALALYTCIGFTSKFLGIDLLNIYMVLDDINNFVRADVVGYFTERKALLWPDKWDIRQLRYMHESTAVFKFVHDKLIAEGAKSIDMDFIWDL